MIHKYPSVADLKASYPTWQKHVRVIKGTTPELRESLTVKKELASALPTSAVLQKAVSTIIDPSTALEDKQAVLASLYTKEMQRLEVLEARQKNYIDPDIEALMILLW